MLKVLGSGPRNARVMLVGEAPGQDDEIQGKPFIGSSGYELSKQLKEARINRDECYITNVCKFRPPNNNMVGMNKSPGWLTDKKTIGKKLCYTEVNGRWAHDLVLEGLTELEAEITDVQPELIIGFGNVPLWAMTGQWGVTNWRGSEMEVMGTHFVPTLHPASILRHYAARPQVMADLRQRCAKRLAHGFVKPVFKFNTAPTFNEVMECLQRLAYQRADVVGDVETSGGHIICLGLAWSDRDALCIPFRGPDGVWWSHDELVQIITALDGMSRCVNWVGQNWNYDAQYFAEDFRLHVMADFDTYIAQSVMYPGVERSLAFLSSMYCEWHCFWKEDAKDWGKIADFDGLFRYCCRDCVANWECKQVLHELLDQAGLMPQFLERMQYSYHVYDMMVRGVNRDSERTAKIDDEAQEAIHERELFVAETAGHPVSYASPKQVATLFYTELGCKTITKRGTDSVTTNDEALKLLSLRYPDHAPLALAILESRSLASLRSNFLHAVLDPDGRLRSSWMATGAETFRLTSSGNAFHRGGPLQNVTDGEHTNSGRKLPNLRSTIIPDPGFTIFEVDLKRADLQVVAWEADDADLKQKFREGVDIHTENAKDLYGIKEPTKQQRHYGKRFVHLTNYGGNARTCAVKTGCTVHDADLQQRRWFDIHPGIKRWQNRVKALLLGTRTITNKFGYRIIYFDRVESIYNEGLAWGPQSTVGILISLVHMRIDDSCASEADILLQGHDSVVGQYRTEHEGIVLPRLYEAGRIAVPYDDPLYIDLELKTSVSSWGEVVEREWPSGN